jgi:hypothetical protein
MAPNEITPQSWAPEACTLPTAERPLRSAQFDELFRDGVLGIERVEPARLRLDLQTSAPVAGRTAELAVAETGCCSFFTFTLTAAADRLVLEVTVPAARIEVLDALADRAAAVRGGT